ncbi:MAG: signal peptidase I [Planctomycetota bacterium]
MRRVARRLRNFAIAVAIAAAAFFALETFYGDVFTVRTPSMEPTIDGSTGEWVLVRFEDASALERFDLVVFREAELGDFVVKRVLGLPGEDVRIVGGDVLVDGKRLPPTDRWPVIVPVFDDRLLPVEDWFHLGSAGAWSKDGDGWLLDATDVVEGSRAGTMSFHKDVGSGYLRRDGTRVPDVAQANDVVLDARVEGIEGPGHVLLEVLEAGDEFQLRVARTEGGYALELHRLPIEPGSNAPPVAEATVERAEGAAFDLELSNVDNRVRVRVDGELVVDWTYDENRDYGAPLPPGRRSIGPRAVLGGVGVKARFSHVRVSRDLYYLTESLYGEFGTRSDLRLGPSEYFVLGDNSADSVDGRRFGPIDRTRVVGEAIAVVWPFRRVRSLE